MILLSKVSQNSMSKPTIKFIQQKSAFEKEFDKSIQNLFRMISRDYRISYEELKMRYTDLSHPIPMPNLNCKPKCIAIKQDGERCTRSCKKNSVYCGKHIKLDKRHNKDEILTWEEYIDGDKYLIDSENYIYIKNGDGAEVVGKKVKNKIVNIV